jgi:hypothetical protein
MVSYLEVFAPANGTLYCDYLDGQGYWHDWAPDGSAPAGVSSVTAVTGPTGNLEVFAIADGTLYHNWLSPSGWGWSGWTGPFDQNCPSDVSCVTAAMGPTGNLEVFAVAADGTLYHDYLDPGAWHGWTSSFGENCPSGVTAASALVGVAEWRQSGTNPGNLHVFAIAGGSLYFTNLDLQGDWLEWRSDFDGAPPNVTAVAGSMGPTGNFEAFAVADGVLYHNYEGADGWTSNWDGPFDANCPSNVTSVTVALGPGGDLHVFAVADGSLYHDYLDQSSWHGWTGPLDGCPPQVSAVTAALGPTGNLEVLVVADGTLYHDYLDASGNWHGWTGPFSSSCPAGATALAAATGPWPATGPTDAEIQQVQTNLKNMQAFNDYVFNHGQSLVNNAYVLLTEQDDSDPGLTVGLNILEGAFWAVGSLGGPIGSFVASFMSGMVAWWASDTPPDLAQTFSGLWTRLSASSLAVDNQLAVYYNDVAGNWGTQFTYNGVTTTLANLAEGTFPAETDTGFGPLAAAALFALDQAIWTTVMQANFVITQWELSSGPLILQGDENDPPVKWDEGLIAGNPAYYCTWVWHESSGCGDMTGWEISEYNIGTGAGVFTDGSMSKDACGYLFIDSADGVTINSNGLFPRATVFNGLGISRATHVVPVGGGGAVAGKLSMSYLRAMKHGQTLGKLIEREGRETVERRIIDKAHQDSAFRAQLALQPRQTLQDFLGVHIPEVVSVNVVVETPRTFAMIVPMTDHRS